MEITKDKISALSTPTVNPTLGAKLNDGGNILGGSSVTSGENVPKNDNGLGELPQLDPPVRVNSAAPSDDQLNMFMNLLLKLLQLAGQMMETQAQNFKNRQNANENVYKSQIGAAQETLTKNRTNAWVGLAAGGMALGAAAYSFKQLGSAGSKTTEFVKLSKPEKMADGVSALSDSSKVAMKGLGREIDQLNTKAQTITASSNAMGNTATSSGQIAASENEYKAAAEEALANLQRKGAESLDQVVNSGQSVIDKLASEMVAILKNVMMASVR